jgi:hypothetical protein
VHGVSKKANWKFKNYPARKPMNNNLTGSARTMLFVFGTLTSVVDFVSLT